jgi:hypothetical protein
VQRIGGEAVKATAAAVANAWKSVSPASRPPSKKPARKKG